jgi:hypothetical protein
MRLGRGVALCAAIACVAWCSPLSGQRLLERVVARVNGYAITLTDVRAARALGVVEAAAGAATNQLIDRQLVLAEVARFAPPEPDAAAVAKETAVLIERAGPGLASVMATTGIDQSAIQGLARDNLRIRVYLDQRFGATAQLTEDEITQYYRIHPEEFTTDGRLMPFAEAEPSVRQRVAAARRMATLARWVSDLRVRADISVPKR